MAFELEDLFQAIKEISESVVEGLSYDRTVLCQITDTSKKASGEYRVSDGSTIFTAYSEKKTYGLNNWVYVMIPEGNYSNRKLIVGNYSNENIDYLKYVNPYGRLVDMSGDIKAELIKEPNIQAETKSKLICEKDLSALYLNGSNRFGIQFEVKTTNLDNATAGNYGLLVNLNYTDENEIEQIQSYHFDSSNFFGNAYKFNEYFLQEMVFELPELDYINSAKVYLYQLDNFINAQDYSIEIRDLIMNFGYDIDKFVDDSILLSSTGSRQYRSSDPLDQSIRNISLHWMKNIDNTPTQLEQIPELYKLHWYYYELEEGKKDELAGDYWVELSMEDPFNLVYQCRPEVQNEYIRIIIERPTAEGLVQYNQALENLKEQDDVHIAELQERIPMETFESRIRFENLTNVSANLAVDLIKAVELQAIDSYGGVYDIYGADGQLINSAEAYHKRYIEATYKSLLTGINEYDGEEEVKWLIPAINTMIAKPKNSENEEDYKPNADGYYEITTKPQEVENQVEEGAAALSKVVRLEYYIKSYYTPTANNNKIKCQIFKNNRWYYAEIELRFGTSGTNGTDYTFCLELDESNTAAFNNEVKIKTSLYDYNGKEVQISGVTYSWLNNSEQVEIEDGVVKIPQNKLNILVAKILKPNLVEESGETFKFGAMYLEAYLPIPVATKQDYYIEGPNRIIYDATGANPNYYKDVLGLYKGLEKQEDITWEMVNENIQPITDGVTYFPQIKDGTIKATSMFFTGLQQCGYIAKKGEKILWIQPLLIIQNRFGNSMLNNWDGALEINEENGSILGTTFAAGVKNRNNTFSGVVIGQKELNDNRDIGIFSYDEGIETFNVGKSGVVKIGASGKGQIALDGKKGMIKSGNYTGSEGMQIDLTEGEIDAWNFKLNSEKIKMDSTSTGKIFEIRTGLGSKDKTLMLVGADIEGYLNNFYLQSSDYVEGSTGMKIDLSKSEIKAFGEFELKVTKNGETEAEQGYIEINTKQSMYPLNINNQFKVSWNGSIEANAGQVGGWYVGPSYLSTASGKKGIILSSGNDAAITVGGTLRTSNKLYTNIEKEQEGNEVGKYVLDSGNMYKKIIGKTNNGDNIYELEYTVEGGVNAVQIKSDGTIFAKTFNGNLNGKANNAGYADYAGSAYYASTGPWPKSIGGNGIVNVYNSDDKAIGKVYGWEIASKLSL